MTIFCCCCYYYYYCRCCSIFIPIFLSKSLWNRFNSIFSLFKYVILFPGVFCLPNVLCFSVEIFEIELIFFLFLLFSITPSYWFFSLSHWFYYLSFSFFNPFYFPQLHRMWKIFRICRRKRYGTALFFSHSSLFAFCAHSAHTDIGVCCWMAHKRSSVVVWKQQQQQPSSRVLASKTLSSRFSDDFNLFFFIVTFCLTLPLSLSSVFLSFLSFHGKSPFYHCENVVSLFIFNATRLRFSI